MTAYPLAYRFSSYWYDSSWTKPQVKSGVGSRVCRPREGRVTTRPPVGLLREYRWKAGLDHGLPPSRGTCYHSATGRAVAWKPTVDRLSAKREVAAFLRCRLKKYSCHLSFSWSLSCSRLSCNIMQVAVLLALWSSIRLESGRPGFDPRFRSGVSFLFFFFFSFFFFFFFFLPRWVTPMTPVATLKG